MAGTTLPAIAAVLATHFTAKSYITEAFYPYPSQLRSPDPGKPLMVVELQQINRSGFVGGGNTWEATNAIRLQILWPMTSARNADHFNLVNDTADRVVNAILLNPDVRSMGSIHRRIPGLPSYVEHILPESVYYGGTLTYGQNTQRYAATVIDLSVKFRRSAPEEGDE